MNTAAIKRYAPQARTNFIAAVTRQAATYGITAKDTSPLEIRGDFVIINERPFPRSIATARQALEKRVELIGFEQAMEQAAYSWFNRLCAIRYMELKGFLEHGRRVLSHPTEASHFQLLDECLEMDLASSFPTLQRDEIISLKLAGDKDEELYRQLLLAQCHSLHQAMPFLFEALDNATQLLLPDNLTKTDSLIHQLVNAIPEEDWAEIEIIGWLYQFYISDKKDQVIGKVVKSEDIPAATQLFTPNWIVKYLVQNSIGRQWLMTYPDSPIRQQMEYYIDPGQQPDEVVQQMAETTPSSLEPESIKVLDPACGSGHILVEAYQLLKAIYQERGYRSRDIPRLILENNLFGLDIDDRAGQLAGFSLLMLAREDDRRLFSSIADDQVQLNILSLQESTHLKTNELWQALNLAGDWHRGQSQNMFEAEQSSLSEPAADRRHALLERTLHAFTQAKTFGSLIDIPAEDAQLLYELLAELRRLKHDGDIMQKEAAVTLLPFIHQAWILAQRYDAVIANPPYMGSRGMNADIKEFARRNYPHSKSDLFAIFMEHAFSLLKPAGYNAQINMQSWMFLSSYERLREWLLENTTIITMAHLGARAFDSIGGEVVSTTAFVIENAAYPKYSGAYLRLVDGKSEAEKQEMLTQAIQQGSDA